MPLPGQLSVQINMLPAIHILRGWRIRLGEYLRQPLGYLPPSQNVARMASLNGILKLLGSSCLGL